MSAYCTDCLVNLEVQLDKLMKGEMDIHSVPLEARALVLYGLIWGQGD